MRRFFNAWVTWGVLIGLVVFVYALQPSPIQAAVCNSCIRNNCCGDVCGAGYSCGGGSGIMNECYCVANAPTSPPEPTDPPPETCPSYTNLCTGTKDCSQFGSGSFAVCKTYGYPQCKYDWVCTQSDPNNNCTSWSAWSPSICYAPDLQTRYCTAPAGVNIGQAQTCPPNPGGGNNPPTGSLSCPSQITLGQSGSFTINGSDVDGNLASAGLYYSSTSSQHWYRNDGSDCNISPYCPANISCTGASCTSSHNWTPLAVGTYYMAVNYYDSAGGKCSGNPFGIPAGWGDCGPNDYCTVTVNPVPTPTPTTAPKSYTINSQIVCTTGVLDSSVATRQWGVVYFPSVSSVGTLSTGVHTKTFTSNITGQRVDVGMDDGTDTGNLNLYGSPPNAAITYGTYFGAPGANWSRDVLPAGTYTINFQAPASACFQPITGACSSPAAHYTCSSLAASTNNVNGATSYTWYCPGSYGGATSPQCIEYKPVTIQVRGVSLSSTPQTCSEITSGTSYRSGSVFDVTKNGTSIGQQTQSGSSYLTWTNTAATYVASSVEAPTSIVQYCRTQNGTSVFGSSSVTAASGSTTTFDVSFSPYGPWFQAKGGGDVYAGGRLVSSIPASATTRRFILDDGPVGALFPSMAIYGSTGVIPYDFDQASTNQGETIVSSKNWLVQHQNSTLDLYSMFYAKFGSPTTADYTNPPSPITKPASRATPYYVSGDVTTTGDWSVGNGEQLILLVDGSITIGGEMHTSGTGVIVVIAKNDISFAPAVGVAVASSTPSVEGVYIAGVTLHTGTSVAGSERFVGSGMFFGNTISLERNLLAAGGNQLMPAETFMYDPSFLVNLPEDMKDTPVSWQEVAP